MGSLMKHVVFVCVENSCRSQMAEAFAKMNHVDGISFYSSGSKASGVVNPKAIASMAEVSYDLSKHDSKPLDTLPDVVFDYAITMGCGDECPDLKANNRLDWQITDPKHMDREAFAEVRDDIKEKVAALIKGMTT